ncbi:MAG: hypothetical protein KJ593_03465 [Candidatus Omnitrophica bacterium]|nr:hypothetical protein [Candidatus Omnitrophota bacterium]
MRTVDSKARKREILLETINEYISSATPVSSESLRERCSLNLSSATIRNVLAELESDGFLTHPHTSAGRIPTDKGYRYYLEFLMEKQNLDESQKGEICSTLYLEDLEHLEAILEKTSDILAELTHYAGIVSSFSKQDRFYFRGLHFLLEQPEFNDVQRVRSFLTILEERARLLELINSSPQDYINIYVGTESHCDEIQECSLVVSAYSKKGSICGRLGVLGPKRMNYSKVISILDCLSKRLTQVLSKS